ILNWGLFGALSIQVYIYYLSFPKDKLSLKVLVGGVYILEVAQIVLLTQTVWTLLVSGFGNIAAFDDVGTTWISVPGIGGLVAVIVQCFYSYRIAIFSGSRIIPGIIVPMSIVSFAGSLSFGVLLKRAGTNTKFFENQSKSAATTLGVSLWTGTSAACDVLIATCMCYFLHKRKYGMFSRTQALLSKLIRMTIETGTLTASIAILTLILFYVRPLKQTNYFGIPLSAEAKLYSTTMLAVLNSRAHIDIHNRIGATVTFNGVDTAWKENNFGTTEVSRNEIRFNQSLITELDKEEICIGEVQIRA
ncbi:hypothetical protein BDN70DRAFT_818964, partial [Pholiota conissans]